MHRNLIDFFFFFFFFLKTLIEEGGSKDGIKAYEDVIFEEIGEYIKKDFFYELPTNEILKIVGKSEIEDVELLCELVSRMSGNKGEESTLLLNVIKREEATLEECIEILSKFEHCPFCQRTSELFNKDKNLPERDFEHELNELQNKIKETKEETKTSISPSEFESNICKAAEEGKLSSIQYLYETCHAYVETKDNIGCTPMNWASLKGRLDIVKYLYETCHANVEAKDNIGLTPINYASFEGHLEVVKYLYETCHADVETKDNVNGCTPINNASYNGKLEVVKYLYETCNADIEAKDNGYNTPIDNASLNGHLEVVKYLYETCHAKISDKTLMDAKTKEIKEYLLSKQ